MKSNKLSLEEKTGEKLIKFCIYLPPEPLVLVLFAHRELFGSINNLRDILQKLQHSYGITINEAMGTFQIDNLQHYMSTQQNSLSNEEILNSYLLPLKRALIDLYPNKIKQPQEYYSLSKQLLTYMVSVVEHLKQLEDKLDSSNMRNCTLARGQLLRKIADAYNIAEEYEKQISIAKEAMEIYQATYGDSSLEYATTLNDLAIAYHNLAKEKRELADLEVSVTLKNEIRGYDIQEMILLEKSLKIEELHSKFDINYSVSLNNLGVAYINLEMYEKLTERTKMLEKALLIQKVYYGSDTHIECGTTKSNLAMAYGAAGKRKQEIQMLREVVEIYRIHYTENHKQYAFALNNLAVSCYNDGNYTEAKMHSEKAAQIYKTHYGEEHPKYINMLKCLMSTYNKLLDDYNDLNYLDSAKNIGKDLRRIIDGMIQKILLDNRLTYEERKIKNDKWLSERAEVFKLLAMVHGNKNVGEYEKQERYLRDALSIYETAGFDKRNLNGYADIMYSLTCCYKSLHERERTDHGCANNYLTQLKKTISTYEKAHMKNDVNYQNLLIFSSNFLIGICNDGIIEYMEICQELTDIIKQQCEEQSEQYASSLKTFGSICSKAGRYKQQEELLLKATTIYETAGFDKRNLNGYADIMYSLSDAYEYLSKDLKNIFYVEKYLVQLEKTLPIYLKAYGKECQNYKNLLIMCNNLSISISNSRATSCVHLKERLVKIFQHEYGEQSTEFSNSLKELKSLQGLSKLKPGF